MKTKRYTKEDIDKIKPFHGDLPEECWRILTDEKVKKALDEIKVEESSEESLEDILADIEEIIKRAA